MSHLVDASAVLTFILQEPGSENAERWLFGASISTVNQSEVLRKLVDSGLQMADALQQLDRCELDILNFDRNQAVEAARLRPLTRHLGLSFADRACLALCILNDLPVYTADKDWSKLDLGIDIRQIR
ncbi:MAG: type II toxin-antitoxin system VapC family toxin [Sphingorhabdus sp.]